VTARVRLPGEYVATSEHAKSAPLALRVVPKLITGLAGNGVRAGRYFFNARLVPANAGVLLVNITGGQTVLVDRTFAGRAHIKLDTQRVTSYRIRTEVRPNEGYAGTVRVLRANIVLPQLTLGARGIAVSQLGGELHSRRSMDCHAPGSSMPVSGARSRIPGRRCRGSRSLPDTSR